MEQMEIIEGNKLIVEFMGGKNYHDQYETDGISCVDTPIRKFDGHSINTKDLKYHSSWDWLMPVVEKIEQITLKEVIGVVASQPYWENDKLRVAVSSALKKQGGFKEATDFPVCFTINGKESWIQYYQTGIYGGDAHFDLVKHSSKSKIESTWNVVIEFIKIFNSQRLTP